MSDYCDFCGGPADHPRCLYYCDGCNEMVPEVTEGNGVEQHLGTYLCPDCEAMWGVEPPADDEDYDDPADVLREQNELYFASVWPVKET